MADVTGAMWRKSSYSSANGGACVEVASNLPGVVAVRDSKAPGARRWSSPQRSGRPSRPA